MYDFGEDIFPPAAFGVEEIAENEKKLFKSIRRRSLNLAKVFDQMDKSLDHIERRNTLYKLAFVEAYKSIARRLPNIVRQIALEACVSSVEYNYEPFVNRLTFAIDSHLDDIITVKPNIGNFSVDVDVNFEVLGEPEEWLTAAQLVREMYEFGKIPDAYVRSDIWAEKIYKPEREGGDVPRQKGDTGEYYDVTENFIGKYSMTINARLEIIPMDKAPFWYFMEYGNMEKTGDGEPYPEIYPSNPTRFVGNTRLFIGRLFEYALNLYKSRADVYLSQLLADEFSQAIGELKTSVQNLDSAITYMEKKSVDILTNIEKYKDEFAIETEKITKEITDIDKEYVQYTIGKGLKKARDSRGRFMKK